MTLWADYVREREGLEVLEKEWGFICYKICSPKECFVQAIYVKPEERQNGKATLLREEVEKLAMEKGCEIMTCKVDHLEMDATLSLKAILSDGFKVFGCEKNVIFLAKELKK